MSNANRNGQSGCGSVFLVVSAMAIVAFVGGSVAPLIAAGFCLWAVSATANTLWGKPRDRRRR